MSLLSIIHLRNKKRQRQLSMVEEGEEEEDDDDGEETSIKNKPKMDEKLIRKLSKEEEEIELKKAQHQDHLSSDALVSSS